EPSSCSSCHLPEYTLRPVPYKSRAPSEQRKNRHAVRLFPHWVASAHADRFDIVAVGVEQESGVVGWAVVGAQSGLPVIAPADLETLRVEAIDRGPVAGREGDMASAWRRTRGAVQPQGRFALLPKARACLVAGAQCIAQCRKYGAVKIDARV